MLGSLPWKIGILWGRQGSCRIGSRARFSSALSICPRIDGYSWAYGFFRGAGGKLLNDDCFAIAGALSCCAEVRKIYEAAGSAESYEIDMFKGGHQFAANRAFGFFDKHLKVRLSHSVVPKIAIQQGLTANDDCLSTLGKQAKHHKNNYSFTPSASLPSPDT